MSDSTILPRRRDTLPRPGFSANIWGLGLVYDPLSAIRWHLAWILRRIIAREKRSQYCHVIKERFRERSTWMVYVNGRISSRLCDGIHDRIGKSLGNLQITKSLRYIECNRKFCRFAGFAFSESSRRPPLSGFHQNSLRFPSHMRFENSSDYKRVSTKSQFDFISLTNEWTSHWLFITTISWDIFS